MIGYYVHHVGRGHLARAEAIIAALDRDVTVLSSCPRPRTWATDWVELPLDGGEDAAGSAAPDPRAAPPDTPGRLDPDETAHGRLHWVPLRSNGLRRRMSLVSEWIDRVRPAALVADVSVEIALLTRLHGVPVVTVALPGERTDLAHELGFDISAAVIAAWPATVDGMVTGLSEPAVARLVPVGAISRHPIAGPRTEADGTDRVRRVLVLAGAGGDALDASVVSLARAATPGWEWRHIGGSSGVWLDDPVAEIADADVVVTHAGQNALADVAAARRPAIVLPQPRPHDEQVHTGIVLDAAGLPALVLGAVPAPEAWAGLLEHAVGLDGSVWGAWNDGGGARRAAEIIARVADGHDGGLPAESGDGI